MRTKSPKESSDKKLRVAAYVRVSTQRQATEGDSLEAQRNAINRHLEHHFGEKKIEYIRFYVEAGRSAKDQNRPQLQKLRAEIINAEIDTSSAMGRDQESTALRNRLTVVKVEIGKLVAVLKEMGTRSPGKHPRRTCSA